MMSTDGTSFTTFLAFALLVSAFIPAHAQNVTIINALKENGFINFLTLARIAGIKQPSADAQLTILAPTNQAINAWLKATGLTMEEMKGRPGLAAAIVAYHVLPRIKGTTSLVTSAKPPPTKTNPLIGITADNIHALKFYLANNSRIVVEDLQGNTAGVVPGKANINVGSSVIHGIDKVMLSGDVYLTVDDFLRIHPEFETMRQLLNQTSLISQLGLKNRTVTIFGPSDAALQSAQPYTSKLTTSQLRDVLKYHIIDGEYSLPADMKPNQLYDTLLPGHGLKLSYTQMKIPTPSQPGTNTTSRASAAASTGLVINVVPDTAGTAASRNLPHVNLANVYAGKITIHGIDRLLMPDLNRKLNASSATQKPTATAPASSKQGRRLLQLNPRSTAGGMTVNSLAMTNTQASIRAAVDGQTSAANAAAVGRFNSLATSSRCFNCVAGFGGFPAWRD